MIGNDGETIRLPRGLVQRIARLLEDDALGYLGVDDFVVAALRRELRRAEKTSYFLKEAPR